MIEDVVLQPELRAEAKRMRGLVSRRAVPFTIIERPQQREHKAIDG